MPLVVWLLHTQFPRALADVRQVAPCASGSDAGPSSWTRWGLCELAKFHDARQEPNRAMGFATSSIYGQAEENTAPMRRCRKAGAARAPGKPGAKRRLHDQGGHECRTDHNQIQPDHGFACDNLCPPPPSWCGASRRRPGRASRIADCSDLARRRFYRHAEAPR